MPNNTPRLDQLQQDLEVFLGRFKTLQLATLSDSGEPDCSSAPFFRDPENGFCIFTSELAQHTRNLLINPRASILIIGPEKESKNLFARERVSLQVVADHVPREDQRWNTLLDAMESVHGNTVVLLRTLPDFHLFRLLPQSGNYVQGFARAYSLSGKELSITAHRQR
jgi:putative heme iron utilization protein